MSPREQLLEQLRPASFAIAYRMLGSVAEAEDVVQEALMRLDRELASAEEIKSPRAFLSTITTRLAIDSLRSARVRRERYVGEWLPEPLLTEDSDDPALRAEMADSISTAMLVLLETLSPEQRAAFLLHDVFDYDYADVAEIIHKSEENTRQLASRARRHLKERRPRFQTSRERRDELARRFFAAVNDGDLDGLEGLLADDVVLTGDGGGKVPALARPLSGRSRVAGALRNWVRFAGRMPGASVRQVEVNGAPGALLLDGDERLVAVWSLEIGDGGIERISSVVNPNKLAHLGAVADLRKLMHAVLDKR